MLILPSAEARLEGTPGLLRLGRRPKGAFGCRTRCGWAGDWPTDPGDAEILERAHQEARVLITLDKDFGELAIVRGLPHSGLIRLVDLSTAEQARLSLAVLAKYGRELETGTIITVEAARVRVRPPTDSE